MTTRNFNGRTKTPRTRSGCLTCRKRKVKCDEQQPTCRRCDDGGRQCTYGLKVCWLDERQNTRRSSPPVTCVAVAPRQSHAKDVSRIFINTTWDDFDSFPEDSETSSSETAWDSDDSNWSPTSMQPELSLTTLTISANFPDPHMPHMDMLLFDFYANRMCKKCALLDANRNSYRRVIVPISFRSQLVLQSCLAAAAKQMTRLSSHYSQAALQYRGSCLKSLHRQIAYLSSGQIPTMVSTKTEILGAILMLCFFDYFNASFQESLAHRKQVGWRAHLDGARRILDLKTTTESPQCDQAVSSFLGHYLATHSVLSYTTLIDPSEGEALLEGGRYWLRRTVRPDSEINSFSGCSNELLSILLEIVVRVRKSPINFQQTKDFAADMLVRLDSLVQYSPTTSEEQPPDSAEDGTVGALVSAAPVATSTPEFAYSSQRMNLAVSNAFRHATIILCHYLIPSTALRTCDRIQQSVAVVLTSLYDGFDDPVWSKLEQGHSVFLWPYFIAACHAFQDEDRITTLTKFRALRERGESVRGVVGPMLEIIERVWKQHDLLDTDADVYRSGGEEKTNVFAWERALKRRGWAFNWT